MIQENYYKWQPYWFGGSILHKHFVRMVESKEIKFKIKNKPHEGETISSNPNADYSRADKRNMYRGVMNDVDYYKRLLKEGVISIKYNTKFQRYVQIKLENKYISGIWVGIVVLSFLAACWYSLKLSAAYPPTAVIYSIVAAVVAYIVNKNEDMSRSDKSSVAFVLLAITVISLAMSIFNYSKYSAYAESLFIKGEITDKEIFVEGDGEVAGGYETVFKFTPNDESSKEYSDIIMVVFISISAAAVYAAYVLTENNHEEPKTTRYA